MANPNPVSPPAFVAAQFNRVGNNEPMAKTNIQVRLPESIDGAIRKLPNRSEFIRAAIAEKLQRDGLLRQGDEK
jgi:hypothetical protein